MSFGGAVGDVRVPGRPGLPGPPKEQPGKCARCFKGCLTMCPIPGLGCACKKPNCFSPRMIIAFFLIALGGSAHIGYALLITNSMGDYIQEFIEENYENRTGEEMGDITSSIVWGCVVNIPFIGMLIGSFAASFLLHAIGVRISTTIACVIIVIGCCISGSSKPGDIWELLLGGRFVMGIGCGMAASIQAQFAMEVPKPIQMCISTLIGIALSVMSFFASILGAFLSCYGGDQVWYIMFYLETIPTLILFPIIFCCVPESPKYLMQKQSDKEVAEEAMATYGEETDVQAAMAALQATGPPYGDYFKIPALRNGWGLAALVNVASAFCGYVGIMIYSTDLLEFEGWECLAVFGTVAIMVVEMLVSLCDVCSSVEEKVPKKDRLIVGLIMMFIVDLICMILVILSSLNFAFQLVVVILLVIAQAAVIVIYSKGLAQLEGSYAEALLPPDAVPRAQNLVTIVHHVAFFIVGILFTFLVDEDVWGFYAFLIFIIPTLLFVPIFIKLMPRTHERPIEEIVEELGGGLELPPPEPAENGAPPFPPTPRY